MARIYGLTGKTPEKPLSGQALQIFNGMQALGGFHSGKDWTEVLKAEFKTRQDPYRVVLYYLLIFKDRGLVAVQEQNSDTMKPAAPAPVPAADHNNAIEDFVEHLDEKLGGDEDDESGTGDDDDDEETEDETDEEPEPVDAE